MHYGKPGTGLELKEGMTFTIEPMLNQGKYHTKMLADGWTAVTKDHKLSAQWEHTILVTADAHQPGCDPGPALCSSLALQCTFDRSTTR